MPKAMLFIHGTWLYYGQRFLAEDYGQEDYRIDYGALPGAIIRQVSEQFDGAEIDLVRTHLFASYPANVAAEDEDSADNRREFFEMLSEEYHYEVELFPINFGGRRLRSADRDAADKWQPREGCVDMALASSMLYQAAIPSAYDISIAVLGDRDFKPVLQHTRRLGKRVAIASVRGSCSSELADPRDHAKVKDCDIIWLNDMLSELELSYQRHQVRCQSPLHEGDRLFWTEYHPRKGQRVYCDQCRRKFRQQEQSAMGDISPTPTDDYADSGESKVGRVLTGTVKYRKDTEPGKAAYAFISGEDGCDYYFNEYDVRPEVEFDDISQGDSVAFEVRRDRSGSRAGAAREVRLV